MDQFIVYLNDEVIMDENPSTLTDEETDEFEDKFNKAFQNCDYVESISYSFYPYTPKDKVVEQIKNDLDRSTSYKYIKSYIIKLKNNDN